MLRYVAIQYTLKPNPSNFTNSIRPILDCNHSTVQHSSHVFTKQRRQISSFCLYQAYFSISSPLTFIYFLWNSFFFFFDKYFTYSLSLSLNILMCNLEPNNARPFLLLQEPTPHFASLYCVAVTCPEPHNPLIILLLLLSFSIFCFLYFLVLFSPKL